MSPWWTIVLLRRPSSVSWSIIKSIGELSPVELANVIPSPPPSFLSSVCFFRRRDYRCKTRIFGVLGVLRGQLTMFSVPWNSSWRICRTLSVELEHVRHLPCWPPTCQGSLRPVVEVSVRGFTSSSWLPRVPVRGIEATESGGNGRSLDPLRPPAFLLPPEGGHMTSSVKTRGGVRCWGEEDYPVKSFRKLAYQKGWGIISTSIQNKGVR